MLDQVIALFKVILLDVSLSGDNAVVIAMAAATLEPKQRKMALIYGISSAVVLRLIFSLGALTMLNIPWLTIVGGALLFWVAYKMYGEIRGSEEDGTAETKKYSFAMAIIQIIIADVSMSLDNVLAVAAASKGEALVMCFGLVLSIGMMAFAANIITKLLIKWPVISWAGLFLIVYVAGDMILKALETLGYISRLAL